jgi:hypothetical protein
MSDFLETHNRLAAMHGYGSMEPRMPKSPQELVAERIADYCVKAPDGRDYVDRDSRDILIGFIVGCLQGWTPPATPWPSEMDRAIDQDRHQGP